MALLYHVQQHDCGRLCGAGRAHVSWRRAARARERWRLASATLPAPLCTAAGAAASLQDAAVGCQGSSRTPKNHHTHAVTRAHAAASPRRPQCFGDTAAILRLRAACCVMRGLAAPADANGSTTDNCGAAAIEGCAGNAGVTPHTSAPGHACARRCRRGTANAGRLRGPARHEARHRACGAV